MIHGLHKFFIMCSMLVLYKYYNVLHFCSRNPSQAESAISKLQSKGKLSEESSGRFEALPLDLMSMKSVREFAEAVLKKGIPINVLANNGN